MLDDRLLASLRGHVEQVETLRDLEAGHFDAVITVGEVFSGCLVGLGVAEAADGEIIAVDGQVWRVPADGTPVLAAADQGLPFAVASSGGRSVRIEVPAGMSFAELTSLVDGVRDQAHDSRAPVVALRIDGAFTDVLLRSEPRQQPPYRLLSDVIDHEVRFPFERWAGTLVGFRFPDDSDGVAIPGLHLHGISADRASGGHCREATVASATLTAWVDDVRFVIPPGPSHPTGR